jgi:quinol monooxygenase YgiN
MIMHSTSLLEKGYLMYGMTGKLIARNGKRGELVAILKQAADLIAVLPECHMYIVNEDTSNETHVWVFGVWNNRQAHDLSLTDERVRSVIASTRPLLAAAPDGAELKVMGGHGINILE